MQNIVVAYFSVSGVTKKLADKLAEILEADIFEIQAETPYTDADLDWQNVNSRSSVEMSNRDCRPAIGTGISDISRYNIILIGFPIWWYREPSIIDTFLEAYDLHDKTIIPFATSGGSGLGDTAQNIAALAKGAKVKDGRRFRANVSESELANWIKTLL